MEKNSWEKGKRIFKAAAMAGAMSLSSEAAMSQTDGNWTIVSEGEFVRNNIPSDQIQTIDLRRSPEDQIDDSKLGFRYIDRSGSVYYWINKNPGVERLSKRDDRPAPEISKPKSEVDSVEDEEEQPKEPTSIVSEDQEEEDTPEEYKDESAKELKEIETVLSDPEIKESWENFRAHYFLAEPYAIDINHPDRTFVIENKYSYENPSEEIKKYHGAFLIVKEDKSRATLVLDDNEIANESFHDFLDWTNKSNIEELKEGLILWLEMAGKRDLSLEEKIKFLKPYFTTMLNNVLDTGPEYVPPVIFHPDYTEEWKSIQRRKKEEGKMKETDPAIEINLDEEKLREMLKGD